MIDLAKITGFDWGEGNTRKTEKHDVSTAESEQIFFQQAITPVGRRETQRHGIAFSRLRQDRRGASVAYRLHTTGSGREDSGDLGPGHAPKGARNL